MNLPAFLSRFEEVQIEYDDKSECFESALEKAHLILHTMRDMEKLKFSLVFSQTYGISDKKSAFKKFLEENFPELFMKVSTTRKGRIETYLETLIEVSRVQFETD